MRVLIKLLLLVVSLPCGAENLLPARFSATFVVKSHGTTVGETQWTVAPLSDDRFVYTTRTVTAGLYSLIRKDTVEERSEWQYHQAMVRPLHYRYERSGGKKDKTVQVAFDWEQGFATNTARGETWRMPVPPETLDKLVYVLALMGDLARGKANIDYTIADGGKLKTYELKSLGEARIETILGTLDTVKVRRIRRESARETTLFCAPSLNYLPVRVEHKEKDGSKVLLLLRSVEGLG